MRISPEDFATIQAARTRRSVEGPVFPGLLTLDELRAGVFLYLDELDRKAEQNRAAIEALNRRLEELADHVNAPAAGDEP